jgi:hypothetical protein
MAKPSAKRKPAPAPVPVKVPKTRLNKDMKVSVRGNHLFQE